MSLLHKIKNQQKKNVDPIIRLMMPIIAGMLACVFCLVSMTWAWFTASVDTPTQTMKSATRSTSVMVYEVIQATGENSNPTKEPVKPEKSEAISLAENSQTTDENAGVVVAGEAVSWKLEANTSYEVVLTGEGDASKGYCKVALSHTESGKDTETKLYTTSVFKKDHTFKFTYNTGGFSGEEGITATQWKEYVEKTPSPTLTIASYWGDPEKNGASQVSLMSLRRTAEEEIMLLSDGDVLGLPPIPCPEAKAETEVELEGFEAQEGAVISAEKDYKISLTLKEGYEMPSEVVVNIGGKDYVVSTGGAEASDDAPYYDAVSGVLTVPSSLLSDGITVSVKATATPIPEEEPVEEETEEETEEQTEETTDNNENQEDSSADTTTDNDIVADDPNKKEEDGEKGNSKPDKTPAGNGGNDDDNDDADDNSEGSSDGNSSSPDNNEDEAEVEKADVKLNLSQLTINLEETKIPTNADLVLTLSAKEDKKLPESIVITLDKTIRDENIEDEEIKEDKKEYIINTDGKDNPEGFEFDAESGELTISSELLEGVREITIAETEENEDENKATLTFEVKNLTFDFTDDEIVTDEDVVITFTAGEGYQLPETIVITIDDKEYTIYTSEEDSDKNPDGITFDTETGKLTISKDLLEDAEAITITAEGVKKEDDKSEEKEENTDADKKDETEDKDAEGKENGAEGGDAADKKPETGTDTPTTEDKTETEGGTDSPNTDDKTETEGEITTPETNPDNTTEDKGNSEGNDDTDGENNGEDEGKTEAPESGTEPTTPTTPDKEDNTDTEQGGKSEKTEEDGEGTTGEGSNESDKDSTENGTEGTTNHNPDTESGEDGETTTPTEPTTPAEPSEGVVTPETPKTDTPSINEPTTDENDGNDNGGTTNTDSSSAENSSGKENDSTQSDAPSESTSSDSPSESTGSDSSSGTSTAPSTSSPSASETSTQGGSTQGSGDASNAPVASEASTKSGITQVSDSTSTTPANS